MKTLYLVRHAEAQYPSAVIKDRNRTLTHTGVSEAHELARRFLLLSSLPQKIFYSEAKRTIATAEIISTLLNIPDGCCIPLPGLYEADAEKLLEMIGENSIDIESVMVVGHNPAVTDLAVHLCKGFVNVFPPSGLACISLSAACWLEVSRNCGRMNYFINGRKY
ncbi:MAG: histidine phosphatase family protein [Bacteroidia bacterium]